MESDDQYDEFGNFIGDEVNSDSDVESLQENDYPGPGIHETGDIGEVIEDMLDSEDEEPIDAEVKKDNLRDAFEAAETIFVDPANTGSGNPIIKPIETLKSLEYKCTDDDLPQTTYSKDYLINLSKSQPERIRNLAVVGGLHVGKTTFMDMLVMETHPDIRPSKRNDQNGKPMRYLDTHKLEDERGISIRSSIMTLLLLDERHRSHPMNFIDCPGHSDFLDDLESALGVVEGAILTIDVLEGITGRDKRIISRLMKNNLPFVVVLNKFDRLILELQLSTRDFYLKIKHTLDDLNSSVHHNEYSYSYTHNKLFSPLKNNVIFSSYTFRTVFTLRSWSSLYEKSGKLPNEMSPKFEMLLWGKVSFKNGKFSKLSTPEETTTFELFIVEPIYKLVTHSLVYEPLDKSLPTLLWDNFQITLPKAIYKQDPQALLRDVFATLFLDLKDLTQSLITNIPSPVDTDLLLSKNILLEKSSEYSISEVFALRLIPGSSEYQCFARVYQGTLRVGDKVHIHCTNSEKKTARIADLSLSCGKYKIKVDEASIGSIVVISGLDDTISKSATIFGATCPLAQQLAIHKSHNGSLSAYKVAVECEVPSELPRLVRGLQSLSRVYAGAIINIEESGEYTILGTGELFLDCFLHDLRYLNSDYLSIKVSDAMVKFSESCEERSVTKLPVTSTSKQNKISIIAEPLKDKSLTKALENGRISTAHPQKVTAKILREEFEWDALAARSLWCAGPKGMQYPSILLDDSLDGETDKTHLFLSKESICAGFSLGINQGPLCGEPVRDTKFKILDAVLNSSGLSASSQVIPMTRNAVHVGLLTASPILLEPIYKVYVTCTYNCLTAIHTLIEKRRGWAVKENAVVATKMYEVEAYVPVIESVGLDTDIRLATQGQAFCTMEFCRWDAVPGDPLDKDCYLPAMKPVPRASLARDFVTKTRKRKGLGGEPNLQRYIDVELFAQLKESGIVL